MKSITFSCSSCDAQYPKWSGRCLQCGAWGTISEANMVAAPPTAVSAVGTALPTVSISEVAAELPARAATGIGELDRVLGGGIVPGSLILLGGEPGIGKSTLVLQIVSALSFPSSSREGEGTGGDCISIPHPTSPFLLKEGGKIKNDSTASLYICGEERPEQIVSRAQRLGAMLANLKFLSASDILSVIATARAEKPQILIIDSIQTVFHPEIGGAAGTVRQVQAVTSQLLSFTKETGITTILIGHVTKEGVVAGPKTLEHLVDVVLSFEGERTESLRLLRGIKNRFGATHEVGLFEMGEQGLKEMKDASALLSGDTQSPGVARTIIIEGSRALPIELQVLVSRTIFGYPQRRSVGFDLNRLQLLLAVLGEHAGMSFAQHDAHVNVVGGLSVREPAADLALCCALLSARLEKVMPSGLVAIGEVGLTGEIRSVRALDQRLQEAKRCGASRFILPKTKNLPPEAQSVSHVRELKELLTKP